MSYNACAWLLDRHLDDGRGANLAIVCDDRRLTYADLHGIGVRGGERLRALGVAAANAS